MKICIGCFSLTSSPAIFLFRSPLLYLRDAVHSHIPSPAGCCLCFPGRKTNTSQRTIFRDGIRTHRPPLLNRSIQTRRHLCTAHQHAASSQSHACCRSSQSSHIGQLEPAQQCRKSLSDFQIRSYNFSTAGVSLRRHSKRSRQDRKCSQLHNHRSRSWQRSRGCFLYVLLCIRLRRRLPRRPSKCRKPCRRLGTQHDKIRQRDANGGVVLAARWWTGFQLFGDGEIRWWRKSKCSSFTRLLIM